MSITTAQRCAVCRAADHPFEHQRCEGGLCECRCRLPLQVPKPAGVGDISDHEPVVGADGRKRCDACGWAWPCPDVRMAPPEPTDDERAVMEMVGLGWAVWERVPDLADHRPRGGTVIGYRDDAVEGRGDVRTYTVLDFPKGRPRYFTLDAHQIDPAMLELPNSSFLRSHWRRLCAEVGKQTGTADGIEGRHIETALTLYQQAQVA